MNKAVIVLVSLLREMHSLQMCMLAIISDNMNEAQSHSCIYSASRIESMLDVLDNGKS